MENDFNFGDDTPIMSGFDSLKDVPMAEDPAKKKAQEAQDILNQIEDAHKNGQIISPEIQQGAKSLEAQELEKRLEHMDLSNQAIFSDIDGTITDNSGTLNARAIEYIKAYQAAGGTFIPVTGRARFESVKSLVNVLDVPFVVLNNGAEIFNRNGERIAGSELTDEEVRDTFAIAEKHGLIWMQNKQNPDTGEEWLYSNFTEESEQAMLDVGIVDTVHNEEGRVGLTAKHVDSSEVMAIPGQNYKIQMMSPDADAVQAAYDEFRAKGIPCMLNMQSKKDGRFHWVEVIRGTKISGIQKLIDDYLPTEITSASVVGDGGNDLTMYKDLHSRSGEPIPNTYTAVQNACEQLKSAADVILESSFTNHKIRNEQGEVVDAVVGGGAAIYDMIQQQATAAALESFVDYLQTLNATTEAKQQNRQEADLAALRQQAHEQIGNNPIPPRNDSDSLPKAA